jgi:hypothetical protein
MEPNINIEVNTEDKEVVIRRGEARPVHIPNGIEVSGGAIGSVYEYLSKSGVEENEIPNSFVTVSYEKRTLSLSYSHRRENPDKIAGGLKVHPDLDLWDINGSKSYSTFSLADFIKMNHHYFENKDVAMKLVTVLRDFKAKVETKIEAADDKRANRRVLVAQVAETNIPPSFILKLPVFVGADPISIEVEININADDLSCSLISPNLKEYIDIQSREIIGEQIDKISKLYPQLRIFQI